MKSEIRFALLLLLAFFFLGMEAFTDQPPSNLRIGKVAVNKVAILGNSITLHGPAKNIGWLGNWGMAASSEDKDFSHLLLKKIERAAKGKPEALIRNVADFEREYATINIDEKLREAFDFKADLIILAIGENVAVPETEEARHAFRKACDNLLKSLDHSGHPTIIVRSCFWQNSTKDDILREAAHAAHAEFVDLQGLDKDERNYARSEQKFEHDGVAAHPGDRGMQAIANAIWQGIERRAGKQME